MPITTNRYKVTTMQQMIDLNGDAKNFKLKFTCKASDESIPFEVLVMTQAQLDNPNSNNLNYKQVTGSITGEIFADKNIYQNYFLLIKSQDDCHVEVISDFEKLPDEIPPEHQHHHNHHNHHNHQHHQHHQHHQQHQHNQPQDSHSQAAPPKPLQNSAPSFLNSNTFLWIVVGIIAIFLIYFIFFYNSGKNKPVIIENNKATGLMSLPIIHPDFSLPSSKKSSKKKKKKHNFDNF